MSASPSSSSRRSSNPAAANPAPSPPDAEHNVSAKHECPGVEQSESDALGQCSRAPQFEEASSHDRPQK